MSDWSYMHFAVKFKQSAGELLLVLLLVIVYLGTITASVLPRWVLSTCIVR